MRNSFAPNQSMYSETVKGARQDYRRVQMEQYSKRTLLQHYAENRETVKCAMSDVDYCISTMKHFS